MKPLILCSLLVVTGLGSVSTADAGEWSYLNGEVGRGYTVCDAVLKHLNGYAWTSETVLDELGFFVSSTVLGYPGWREPPWQELDPWVHRNLVEKLMLYYGASPSEYFGTEPARTGIEQKLRKPLRLRMWRTRLVNTLGEGEAPPGDQTVVELKLPFTEAEVLRLRQKQPDKPAVGDGPGSLFLVTDDLLGPDPRVTESLKRRLWPILLFDGKPHFLHASGPAISLARDFGHGPTSFCELNYDFKD
jgi:hypothetical protein